GGPTPVAELQHGKEATVVATVREARAKLSRFKGKWLTEAVVVDDAGSRLQVVWFNQPYVAKKLQPGTRVALAGPVTFSRSGREMRSPHYELLDDGDEPRRVGGLMPKYHATEGLTSRRIAMLVDAVIDLADGMEDDLPEPVRRRHALPPLPEVIRLAHKAE